MSFSHQNWLAFQLTVILARPCIRMSFSHQNWLAFQLTVTLAKPCIRMSFSHQNWLEFQLTVTLARPCIRMSFSHQNWFACQLTVTLARLCIRDTNISTTVIVRQFKREHIHIILCFTSNLIQGMLIKNEKNYPHELKTISHTATD